MDMDLEMERELRKAELEAQQAMDIPEAASPEKEEKEEKEEKVEGGDGDQPHQEP